MAAAAADAMGQAFQAAAINAQLTALPIFSDNVKEDKLTAKQWLEKVVINKTGGNWTDIQTISIVILNDLPKILDLRLHPKNDQC